MKQSIINAVDQSIAVKTKILQDSELLLAIEKTIMEIVSACQKRGKVLFCGNGGSAADAQHLAAELSGRFYFDRPALYAEALHVNTSFVTAVSNDFGYDFVFSRMVEASGRKGDILVALSTSGNSMGIINAIEKAKDIQMIVIGFTGSGGGKMKELCDILINVPSEDTPRIQEAHITLGHIVCEQVEKILFKD